MASFQVFLSGGPEYLPEKGRLQVATSLTEKIRHRFGGGFEHFVHEGEFITIGGKEVAVFRWTTRTSRWRLCCVPAAR
ncbi:DUF5988 family protein [Streptomyces sp. 5-10]|uniref:DUF5988 family protein n=1 Tax=Streptomyces sp. 5-10 TaxID=878925 RepID=UPI001CC2BADB|nr:DUF5988 family protein [Streptomyces sp. 5-10]